MLERLYEKAHAWGDRPLTGRDLSRMIDETMRETRQAVGDESPSPYDLSARPGRLGVPRSKLG